METNLTAAELRVLGCLLEKEMATPDYYPLSLNGLINACNQKTNREPVVDYDEDTVNEALAGLKKQGLARQSNVSRVAKFEEMLIPSRNLVRREAAILCVLMLRGPQTPGELRSRSDRLHDFTDLEAVAETLEALSEMDLVTKMARQPGCKESRYAHLLAGEPQTMDAATAAEKNPPNNPSPRPGIASLTEEVALLRNELATLRAEFESFRSQF